MPQLHNHGRRLDGKAAIVTGAGAEGEDVGIGRATAVVLAKEGAKVCCADLELQRAEATAASNCEAGGDAFALAGDVSDVEACERFVSETRERFGRLDVLVNNVGMSRPTKLETLDEAQWTRMFDVNLKSVVLMCKQAIPVMAAGGGGSIINISSIAGIRAHGSLAYGATKAAMAHLTRDLAVLYGRQGVRANTIAPGHLMTAHVAQMFSPEMREMRRKVGPLGVEGDPWDVAYAAAFLASDEARFITGVLLPVDGGVTETAPLTAHAFIMGES